MAQQGLDHAQIGAALQQMRGEGMAQDVGRDARRADPGGHRDILQQAVEPLPGQVAFLCPRGEQEPRGRHAALHADLFLGRIAAGQPRGQRFLRGGAERDHAFLVALAADQQHRRIAAGGRDRQADQLADPHAGSVKQFHQAAVADLLGQAAALIARGVKQRLDLVEAKRLGQALRFARPRDADRRIVGAPAFLVGEAIKLPDRREPARAGRFGQPLGLAADQIGFDVRARQRVERQRLRRDKACKVVQIAAIAQQRVARRSGLGGLGVQKCRNPACRVGPRAHPRRSRITSSSAVRRATLSSPAIRSSDSPATTRR